MSTADSLPVVDIAALAAPQAAAARTVADALCRAYEQTGFAYVTGHGIPEAQVAAAFAASRAFHASPPGQKQRLAINAAHRGYMGLATSTVVTSTVNRNTHPNLSESLLVMHEVPEDDPRIAAGAPLAGPNQWPDWLPGFRAAIEGYAAAAEAVCRRLLRGFELGLGLPDGYLAPMFAQPVTFLRLLHYPPHPADAPDNQFGSAPHTDYGCMTLLAQDDSGGLQVRRRDGSWLDAPPIAGAFVLNVGDIMPIWTNNRFVSTPHRVVNRSGGDRYSLPFFFDPGMDTEIRCLPTCQGPGNPPRHPPMIYGDYLMARLDRNYDYRKDYRETAAADG